MDHGLSVGIKRKISQRWLVLAAIRIGDREAFRDIIAMNFQYMYSAACEEQEGDQE